jgi:hypothetical protein
MFNKSTRSYMFRELVANHYDALTWREARLMFKGATVAAILRYRAPNKPMTMRAASRGRATH